MSYADETMKAVMQRDNYTDHYMRFRGDFSIVERHSHAVCVCATRNVAIFKDENFKFTFHAENL